MAAVATTYEAWTSVYTCIGGGPEVASGPPRYEFGPQKPERAASKSCPLPTVTLAGKDKDLTPENEEREHERDPV
jgi:hypothetical protein